QIEKDPECYHGTNRYDAGDTYCDSITHGASPLTCLASAKSGSRYAIPPASRSSGSGVRIGINNPSAKFLRCRPPPDHDQVAWSVTESLSRPFNCRLTAFSFHNSNPVAHRSGALIYIPTGPLRPKLGWFRRLMRIRSALPDHGAIPRLYWNRVY